MQVLIQEYEEDKPNGDRSTHPTKSSRFVVLINEDCGGQNSKGSKVFVAKVFDCFDPFHCSVTGRSIVFSETQKYARGLAGFLGCEVWHCTMQETVVTEKQWTVFKTVAIA